MNDFNFVYEMPFSVSNNSDDDFDRMMFESSGSINPDNSDNSSDEDSHVSDVKSITSDSEENNAVLLPPSK